MNAPRTPTASTVAPLLATLAVFCATLRARVLASIWRAPSPFPLFGAWPAPGFFFAVDPADPDERRLPWDVWGAEIWERTRG